MKYLRCIGASLIAQLVKNLPAMQETPVRFLGWEDPVERDMATHSSILAWRIPWDHYIVPGVTKRRTQLSDFSLHLTSVVLHPTGPQGAQPWTKQKAGRQGQRHREFARHGDLTQRSWGDSPVCIVDSRQDVAEASLLRGEGGFPLRGE